MPPNRVFLLSPAHCGGERAKLLYRPEARFELAVKLRTPQGAPIGDIFSFLSGLYFRGKLAYARRFAAPPAGMPGQLVITTNRGLLPAETYITLKELQKMGSIPIDADDRRYRAPLNRAVRELSERGGDDCEFVLLGSVATGKYVDVLLKHLDSRLCFPADFVGRGDMSRGGLMLRCVQESRELSYLPIHGATRHGQRPPKLEKRPEILKAAMKIDSSPISSPPTSHSHPSETHTARDALPR
jgi:hypothetical protein